MPQMNWTYEEVVLAGDLVANNGWDGLAKTDARVAELSDLLRAATIHPVEGRKDTFRNLNSVARKTYDVSTLHPDYKGSPTKGGRHEAVVLEQFLSDPEGMHALAVSIRSRLLAEATAELEDPEVQVLSAHEGTARAVTHVRRERDPKLRQAKIDAVVAAGGAIACQVCTFDFGLTYGQLGQGYIEVHHVRPLHDSGPVLTRLEDLAMLCANCHRMVHRARPWITPDELANRLGRVS